MPVAIIGNDTFQGLARERTYQIHLPWSRKLLIHKEELLSKLRDANPKKRYTFFKTRLNHSIHDVDIPDHRAKDVLAEYTGALKRVSETQKIPLIIFAKDGVERNPFLPLYHRVEGQKNSEKYLQLLMNPHKRPMSTSVKRAYSPDSFERTHEIDILEVYDIHPLLLERTIEMSGKEIKKANSLEDIDYIFRPF